jgi:hypothetical protein
MSPCEKTSATIIKKKANKRITLFIINRKIIKQEKLTESSTAG